MCFIMDALTASLWPCMARKTSGPCSRAFRPSSDASDQLPLHAVSGRRASLRHRRGTLLPLFASATPVGAAGGWRPRPPRMQLKYNPRTLRVPYPHGEHVAVAPDAWRPPRRRPGRARRACIDSWKAVGAAAPQSLPPTPAPSYSSNTVGSTAFRVFPRQQGRGPFALASRAIDATSSPSPRLVDGVRQRRPARRRRVLKRASPAR